MKKLLTFSASAFIAFVVMFGAAIVLNSNTAYAADEEPAASGVEVTEQPAEEQNNDVYTYTAQVDDTYSQMARKAVQTYGIVGDVSLSQAQIIAAETNLTIEAGSPLLVVGQVVEISKADVKAAVDAASELSQESVALWQEYVTGVDFNTNNVGEAK